MKAKAHTRYELKDGTRVPGVTTVIGILNKPALVPWANRIGLAGIDVRKYVDDKAAIGTLAHHMAMCNLKGEKPDTSDYSANQISQAETCFIKFLDWKKGLKIEPIIVEDPLVSEIHSFGGTPDLLAKINRELTLVDLKTGKGIFPEMALQLGGYEILIEELNYQVVNKIIVRIGRDEEEGFETQTYNNLALQRDVFLHCLAIYNLQKQIKRG
jgi:hypothetical protein